MKISRIYAMDPRRAYIAYKYLSDMRLNLIEVYKAMRHGGRYVIVVGNNKIRGELFEPKLRKGICKKPYNCHSERSEGSLFK